MCEMWFSYIHTGVRVCSIYVNDSLCDITEGETSEQPDQAQFSSKVETVGKGEGWVDFTSMTIISTIVLGQ